MNTEKPGIRPMSLPTVVGCIIVGALAGIGAATVFFRLLGVGCPR